MGFSTKPGSAALPKPHSTPSPSLAEFGGAFTNTGGAVGETQVVAQGPNLISWIGTSADAYTAESLDIQDRAVQLQDVLAVIDDELTAYGEIFQVLADTTIPNYQEQWDEAITTHDANVEATRGEMETARAQTPPDQTFDDSSFRQEIRRQGELLEETQDELARLYNLAVCDVDDAAATTATNISAALDSYVPRGTDGGLPSRADIGSSLFGDNGGILGAQAQWETASIDAEDAIEILSDVDENGFPTEEALEEFNEEYGDRLAEDPYFATAFSDALPPETAIELAAKLSSMQMYDVSQEYRDTADVFLTNIGASIMVATGSKPVGMSESDWSMWQDVNGGFTIGDDQGYDEWLGGYLDDLHSAGELRYDHEGVSELSNRSGYHLLAQYVGTAAEEHESLALSDAFLNGMPGDAPQSSIAHRIINEDFNNNVNYMAIDGFGFYDSSDPIINLIEAMDGNPEATRTFLASDTSFDYGNNTQNMTSYLVSHRDIVPGHEHRWHDGGAQLGLIIDEATSMPDARQHSDTFLVLDGFLDGYTDGLQEDQSGFMQSEQVSNWFMNKDENGQDLFGYYNPELRHWAGSILEEYASDLAREVRTPTGSGESLPYTQIGGYHGSDYSLTLSPELRDAITDADNGFFHDLSYDEPAPDDPNWATEAPTSALSKISVAAVEDMRVELTDARIRDFNGEDGQLGRYEDAIGDYGALLSHIELADETADISRGQTADDRNSTVRSTLDFATEAFPIKRIPGFDQLSNTAQDAIQATAKGGKGLTYEQWLSTSNAANASEAHAGETEVVTQQLSDLVRDINIDAQNMTGPQPDHVRESDSQRDPNLQVLTEDGYIMRWDDMTVDQQSTYRNQAQDYVHGDGAWTGSSVNDLPQIVNEAYNESNRTMP